MLSQKICVTANHFPFASLPLLPMGQIVELVGGGFPDTPDNPETYGASLEALVEVFPSSEDLIELVEKWFALRYLHCRSITSLRYRLSWAIPYSPSLQLQNVLIKIRLCRFCDASFRKEYGLTTHCLDNHPAEWIAIGKSLTHNRMPRPLHL